MKWFKHVVDAHRGRSMNALYDAHGHVGPMTYWAILEMCAEKWWSDAQYDEEVMAGTFSFTLYHVAMMARSKPHHTRMIVASCDHHQLFKASVNGNEITINFPKFLELLDPDAKYNRKRRVKNASESRLDLEEDLEEKKIKKKKKSAGASKSALPDVLEFDLPVETEDAILKKGTSAAIVLYCQLYNAIYHHWPKLGEKQKGILKNFVRSHKVTSALEIIHAYFRLEDVMLAKQAHPVELIDRFTNEAIRFVETGKLVTRKTAREMDDNLTKEHGIPIPHISDILAEQQKLIGGNNDGE